MKTILLSLLFISALSFAGSVTETMTWTYNGIQTIKTETIKYSWSGKTTKTIHCTTLIDTDNEEVISKKCTTKKY